MLKRINLAGWIFVSILLLLYSFTQVDLGLTLTRISIWQVIQRFFQNIGYFNRPLSAGIFLILILMLFSFYFLSLFLAGKQKLTEKDVWKIIIFVSVILFFSYNAFSYDLFNYIFDAKILTFYHQNPYLYKALDYPSDPMLSFMHWTHRTYPYGPFWLLFTAPLSFIAFGYFLLTLYLFKLLSLVSFILGVFFFRKIVVQLDIKNKVFPLVFFALNPLVLIESLISSHNDIVVIFLALLSFYFLLSKKNILSIIFLILSIGVKFSTIYFIPIYIYLFFSKNIKKFDINCIYYFLIGAMIPIFLASTRTNFQPWYILIALPFAALLSNRYYIFIPAVVFSFISLFQYLPFLYLGNWDNPVPNILSYMNLASVVISVFAVGVFFIKHNVSK